MGRGYVEPRGNRDLVLRDPESGMEPIGEGDNKTTTHGIVSIEPKAHNHLHNNLIRDDISSNAGICKILNRAWTIDIAKGQIMFKRKGQASDAVNYNKDDKGIALGPHDVGPGWKYIRPENLKLSEGRKYDYREVKAYALEDANTMKRAQLLIVLFDYSDEQSAKDAYIEIGQGLESEMPKDPKIGDESTIYELDMRPMVEMKICAFRKEKWLAIFTIWMFQDFELNDAWVKDLLKRQYDRMV